MTEQTQTQEKSVATVNAATVNDFKHSVLIVSVLINLTLFLSWVLAHAAAGTI